MTHDEQLRNEAIEPLEAAQEKIDKLRDDYVSTRAYNFVEQAIQLVRTSKDQR